MNEYEKVETIGSLKLCDIYDEEKWEGGNAASPRSCAPLRIVTPGRGWSTRIYEAAG